MEIKWESGDIKENRYEILLMGVFEKETSKVKSKILKSYGFSNQA